MTERTAVLEVFKRPTLAGPNADPAKKTTRFYWRLRAENGEIVGDGAESYTRRNDAVKAAERAKALMASATVEVIA